MGERLNWQQIVEKYPDCWVAVRSPIFSRGQLVSGIVLASCPDTKIAEVEAELEAQDVGDFGWFRTAEVDYPIGGRYTRPL